MAEITYVPKTFNDTAELMIERSNAICAEFAAQGISLTLRSLYYRLIARGLFPESRNWARDPATGRWFRDPDGTPNTDMNYKWLGEIINDARLAGRLDWDYLDDEQRVLRDQPHWDDPEGILNAVASQYRTYRWASQPEHVEVWIEKDALLGVIRSVCTDNDVPYFSCRGYTSQSAMHDAALRLRRYEKQGQKTVVIHLGDHDPSGVDMSRDIQDRLELFGSTAEVIRIALTMEQIEQYQPPPNPAKLSDSRAAKYIDIYGDDSWELDAMDPAIMQALIADAIAEHRDDEQWALDTEAMETDRFILGRISARYGAVRNWLRDEESGADYEEGDDL